MSGKKVGDLSKDVGITEKELLALLEELGVDVKGADTELEDDVVDRVRIRLVGRRPRTRKTPAKRPTRRRPPTDGEQAPPARRRGAGESATKAPAPDKAAKKAAPDKAAKKAAPDKAAKKASPKKAPTKKAAPPEEVPTEVPPDSPAAKLAKAATKKPAPAEAKETDPAKSRKAAAARKQPATEVAAPDEPATDRTVPSAPPPVEEEAKASPADRSEPRRGKAERPKVARSADKGVSEKRAGAAAIAPTDEVPFAPSGELEDEAVPEIVPAAEFQAEIEEEGEEIAQALRERQARRPEVQTTPSVSAVTVKRGVSVQEFAALLGVSTSDVIKRLINAGSMKTATMSLTDEEVELLGIEYEVETTILSPDAAREAEDEAWAERDAKEDEGHLEPRPPVVTVMGHVDHGKTLLLDRIRESDVAAAEAGGITQHIGAYRVNHGGRWITFIDTPGHEAFTMMRARGASITDIAILVVAADDGVMPQTQEAISHIRAAGVPMIVAINKIDRPDADPQRVRAQLTEANVVVEDFGGDTPVVEISALERIGIDDLLEMVVLVSDLAELKANPSASASGVCLEAHLDVGRGPVATVLVKRGTLRRGDVFIAGLTSGRVRALFDENAVQVDEAGPSTPVQVLGFEAVPEAGDDFRVVADEKTARSISNARRLAERRSESSAPPVARLEDLFAQLEGSSEGKLSLVVKADVQGSLEAVTGSLRKLERPEIELSVVHQAVGGITENDVTLAQASKALIVGFNVRPDRKAREAAQRAGVEIRTYEVIYQLIDDIQQAMVGLLAPEYEEVVTGTAEVRATFKVPRVGVIAGCYVQEGEVNRGSKARLIRDGAVVYSGSIASLRRFKDDVRQVAAGYECGIGLEDFQDIKEGDLIETYEQREIPRS